MNLADPTVGDIIDRLTILSMKDTDEAFAEAARLRAILLTRMAMKTPEALVELVIQVGALGAVNGRLWEMHERPEGVALSEAMALNQRRRARVAEIG